MFQIQIIFKLDTIVYHLLLFVAVKTVIEERILLFKFLVKKNINEKSIV